MSDSPFEFVEDCSKTLRLDFSSAELALLAEENNFSPETLEAIQNVFGYMKQKKVDTIVNTLLKMSRLPLKTPKTFSNFDFSVIRGENADHLQALSTLATIHAHKNIVFIGPAGTGKTHLAQAFGYECCKHGMKTYFIKMTELRDKFTAARNTGKVASMLNGLVRPSCLIIDEVGHCEFDKENTRLFFDLIDRRCSKAAPSNIIFTSNKNPPEWRSIFNEDDSLLCAMDRIFDEATVFTFKGESYRGKKVEHYALQTVRVKST